MIILNRNVDELLQFLPLYGDMLSVKEAYWVSRDVNVIKRQGKIQGNFRDKLYTKYGSPMKDGRPGELELIGANKDKFIEAWETFLDNEIDVEIKPIMIKRIEELKAEGKTINTQMMAGLNTIIVIE